MQQFATVGLGAVANYNGSSGVTSIAAGRTRAEARRLTRLHRRPAILGGLFGGCLSLAHQRLDLPAREDCKHPFVLQRNCTPIELIGIHRLSRRGRRDQRQHRGNHC